MRVVATSDVAGGSMWVNIWFVDERPGRKRAVGAFKELTKTGPAEIVFTEVDDGERIEPTLRLPAQAVEELRRGLDEHGPFTADNLTFVRDVIGTRDRLLTLVEKLVGEGPVA